MKKFFALTILSTACTSALAADTRSQAMGGTGVASADYLSSVLSNPALINRHSDDTDDFGLIIPSFNMLVRDENELRDHIDTFQDSFDNLSDLLERIEFGEAVDAGTLQAARQAVSRNLAKLNGGVNIEGNTALAVASPSRVGGIALYANTNLDIAANIMVAGSDVDVIANSQTPDELDSLDSQVQLVGAAISEVGFAYANQIEIAQQNVYWSVTPKYQQIDTFNYVSSVNGFDEDDFDTDQYTRTENNFNLDLGVATEITQNITVGLTAKNLIEQTYKAVTSQGLTPTYKVGPEYVAGIAYRGEVLTLAAELDLTAPKHSSRVKASQYARFGLELDAFDWAQFRAGYSYDMNGDKDGTISVGLGFSPFGVARLDIMAQQASDNEIGAGLQLSFTL